MARFEVMRCGFSIPLPNVSPLTKGETGGSWSSVAVTLHGCQFGVGTWFPVL